MTPPKTTEGTVPMSLAAKPDSKAPISLEDPMNTPLTDETRPLMESGVKACMMLARITTLTLSAAPMAPRSTRDSQ